MSRAKPYARESREFRSEKRDTESAWTHDKFDARGTARLADRLSGPRSTPAASGTGPGAAGGLKHRLSGKELLPSTTEPRSKLFGFDESSPSPSRAARPTRASRARGLEGGRALVASSLAALTRRDRDREPERDRGRDSPASRSARSSPASGLSIIGAGAASVTIRVERLARGTTAEDVMSAFAPTPIASARLCSAPGAGTATVEVEVRGRAAADALVAQYDGVVADGETLRLTIVSGRGERAERTERTERADDRGREAPRNPRRGEPRNGGRSEQSTGKMYADTIDRAPREDRSLSARLGRR